MRIRGISSIFGGISTQKVSPASNQPVRGLNQQPVRKVYALLDDIPFFRQTNMTLCAEACTDMLLEHHAKPRPPHLGQDPRKPLKDLNSDEIIERMANGGMKPIRIDLPYDKQWREPALSECLQKHGPIICIGNSGEYSAGHSVVLVGVEDGHVQVNDPYTQAGISWSLAQFNHFLDWSDRNCMMAFAEGTLPTRQASAQPATVSRTHEETMLRPMSAHSFKQNNKIKPALTSATTTITTTKPTTNPLLASTHGQFMRKELESTLKRDQPSPISPTTDESRSKGKANKSKKPKKPKNTKVKAKKAKRR